MKKLFTLLALTISFSMNAQVSTSGTTQNGNYSSAIGYYSYAGPGAVSTAMGRSTDATGWASTSMGGYTLASGQASTAMGYYSIAADWGSLAIGQYNLSNATANDADNFSTSNVAFVIGNGVDASNKSDAFKVMFNGDATVSGDLSIKGNDIYSSSAAAITLTGSNVSTLGDLTVTGNDITFGNGETISNGVNGTISLTSTDVSVSNNLSIAGDLSVGGTTITSTASELNLLDGVTTIGDGILASVTESSNTGVRLSTSNASNHGEIGDAAVDLSKQGASSTTRGATGYGSFASGYNTTASESYSTALGSYTVASGYGSTALGRYTTASGYYSVTMGRGTTASDWGSLVIGRYNSSSSSATSSDSFSTSNPAFVIGNGSDWNSTSDAFKVMFNGERTYQGHYSLEELKLLLQLLS